MNKRVSTKVNTSYDTSETYIASTGEPPSVYRIGTQVSAELVDCSGVIDSLLRRSRSTSASVAGRISTGPHAGQRVLTGGIQIDDRYREALTGPRSANVAGFSLHANVAIAASDRPGLERLCRYTARPATQRLSSRSDGRLTYRLKRPWSNGTTHIILEPIELVEKVSS